MNRDVVVLGGGVSGLTCAVRLQIEGFRVRIITAELSPNITSAVAAALWYPYRAYPHDRVLAWAAATLQKFATLATVAESGVTMVELREYFPMKTPDPWWRSAVTSFRRLAPNELRKPYQDGCAIQVPLMETPKYLPYLTNEFQRRGGSMQHGEVRSLVEVDSPLIINCTGLGARQLCADPEVFPIRGQVVHTSRPAVAYAQVDHEGPIAVSYVIPRSNDCVLGTTAEEGNWSREVDEGTTHDIVSRCTQLEPRLRDAAILGARAGLRPGRATVRLESEKLPEGRLVIHNYGHGGAGFTLSWGCADEVASLATQSAGRK